MSNKTLNLNDQLYQYLLGNSLRESDVMARLREVTAELPDHEMQISPEQGQFMQLLVRMLNVQHAIEIGTFTGYSALAVALALPGNGELICCDLSEEWVGIGLPFWKEAGVDHKITFKKGSALDTLEDLLKDGRASAFDFAFIDADKINYLNYYEQCLQLIRPGGLILIDNTLWNGAVCDASDERESTVAIREFNLMLHKDERIFLSLLPLGDGLTLALKK
jgi:predicted O-methyltransferase YrrM